MDYDLGTWDCEFKRSLGEGELSLGWTCKLGVLL